MQAAPSKIKAVPSKAERALKMKKDARFGARAVAMLSKKNNTVVNCVIYKKSACELYYPLSFSEGPYPKGNKKK